MDYNINVAYLYCNRDRHFLADFSNLLLPTF